MCHSAYSWSNRFFSFLETEVRSYIRVWLRITAAGVYLCTENLPLLRVHAAVEGQGKLLSETNVQQLDSRLHKSRVVGDSLVANVQGWPFHCEKQDFRF